LIKNTLILFILLFFCGTALPQESQSVPITQFKQFVEDQTGTLTQQQLRDLRLKLETFDKETSTQIVVYMIPSLNDESLEDVSIRLAEKNKIGKKDKNNGVLMLVVKDDRKIRIEVGYGLEGVLTDAVSSQIIRKDITPYFKLGQYYEGINSGVDAIISVSKGEYTADKKSSKDGGDDNNIACCFGLPIFVVIIFGVIFVMIIFSIISRIMGFGKSAVFGNRNKSNWYWGGGGFGGGSSGGFGGGGFSGGGGSFGGGGASGSW
jgi:uncharacterized protein